MCWMGGPGMPLPGRQITRTRAVNVAFLTGIMFTFQLHFLQLLNMKQGGDKGQEEKSFCDLNERGCHYH